MQQWLVKNAMTMQIYEYSSEASTLKATNLTFLRSSFSINILNYQRIIYYKLNYDWLGSLRELKFLFSCQNQLKLCLKWSSDTLYVWEGRSENHQVRCL